VQHYNIKSFLKVIKFILICIVRSVVGLTSVYVYTTFSRQIVFNMHEQSSYLGNTKSCLN